MAAIKASWYSHHTDAGVFKRWCFPSLHFFCGWQSAVDIIAPLTFIEMNEH